MKPPGRPGLLVDSNLLVLFVVGTVNPARISQFKRTRKYEIAHFEFLCQLLGRQNCLYTLPHILAEVSNLTDLSGHELSLARATLRETIAVLDEEFLPSDKAASGVVYDRLGLTDSSIMEAARQIGCDVLTDDLDLYLALWEGGITAHNFMHLWAQMVQS